MCVCVRACACACVCVCLRACVRACVRLDRESRIENPYRGSRIKDSVSIPNFVHCDFPYVKWPPGYGSSLRKAPTTAWNMAIFMLIVDQTLSLVTKGELLT